MRAFRIGTQRHAGTVAEAFSGQGSLYGHGRWNHRGRLAVYVAQHASLALLEVLVHLDRASDVQPHVQWEIDIPEGKISQPKDLPKGWDTDLEISRNYGDDWLDGRRGVALRVPSVIIKTEFNLLLNPAHPDFDLKWVVGGPQPVHFDRRLLVR